MICRGFISPPALLFPANSHYPATSVPNLRRRQNRGQFLTSFGAVAAAGVLSGSPAFALDATKDNEAALRSAYTKIPPPGTTEGSIPLTFDEALAVIRRHAKPILAGVLSAGGSFLYRGEVRASSSHPSQGNVLTTTATKSAAPRLLLEEPDLLDPRTYGSTVAAEYFAKLDAALEVNGAATRPSNAHIVVADVQTAAQWGPPMSVWPLGDALSFTWFEHSFELWDAGWEGKGGSLLNGNRPAYFWRDGEGAKYGGVSSGLTDYLNSGLVFDENLPEAIRSGHEILFRSSAFSNFGLENAYVAIPAAADAAVRRALSLPEPRVVNPRERFSNVDEPKQLWSRPYSLFKT